MSENTGSKTSGPSIHNLGPKQLDRYRRAVHLAQTAIEQGEVDLIAMIAIGEEMPRREEFENPSTSEWEILKEERRPTRGITIPTAYQVGYTAPGIPPEEE